MIGWFQRNRTSVRLAFLLRLFTMGAGAVLSLVFTKLLLRAMGDATYGIFLAFQSVTRLGGLGDMGMSGAVGVRAGQMLGRGEDEKLRKLLASARALSLLLAGLLFIGFAVVSPWLPGWLHFYHVPGTGSLTLLFVWGGASAAMMIVAGYFNNLNLAHGTVTWPILPAVFLGQLLAPLLHWQLALHHAPLWVQNLPYVGATFLLGWLAWRMLQWSHPWLGDLRPLQFDGALSKSLIASSGWVYLSSLGSAVYFNTDRLVINAGFGPEILPSYQANYKACELIIVLVLSASYVGLPKLTQWISSPHAADQQRARSEIIRLNIFQIVVGCAAALGYLALNDLFVKLWLGEKYQGPLLWQVAFACNLAVTTGGEAGIQMAGRCGEGGLKKLGLAVGATGLLNLALSVAAMKYGSIAGIAIATVIAQTFLSISMGRVTCRHFNFSLWRWTLKSWLLPLAVVLAAAGLKTFFPDRSVLHIGALLAFYTVLLATTALLAGVNRQMLRTEWSTVRKLLNL